MKVVSEFVTAIAGNTLGFNNNNQDTLNTLRNIESYIERGKAQLGKIDKILILLGSNDCKAVYAGKTAESISNLNALIHKIKAGFPTNQPTILLISPPPAADDSLLTDKYKGMSKKLKKLIPKMQKVAQKNDIPFLNIFQPLYSDRNTLTSDGVHYKKEGYQLMAQKINEFIDFN